MLNMFKVNKIRSIYPIDLKFERRPPNSSNFIQYLHKNSFHRLSFPPGGERFYSYLTVTIFQEGESLRIDRSGAAPLLADEFLAGVYWLAKALSPSLWKERRPARWLFPLKNISPPCHHSHRGVELIIEQTAWYLTYVHRLFPSAEREDRAAPRPPRRFARENSHEEEIYNSRAFLRDNTCNLQLIIG